MDHLTQPFSVQNSPVTRGGEDEEDQNTSGSKGGAPYPKPQDDD